MKDPPLSFKSLAISHRICVVEIAMVIKVGLSPTGEVSEELCFAFHKKVFRHWVDLFVFGEWLVYSDIVSLIRNI